MVHQNAWSAGGARLLVKMGLMLLLLVTNIGTAHAQANLKGMWEFGEGTGATTVDSSGNGVTGTLTSGTTWTANGKNGSALNFNGTSAVNLPQTFSMNQTNALTLSAWVKTTATATSQVIIGRTNNGNPNYFLRIQGVSRVPRFSITTPSGQQILNAGPVIATNTWYHIAGVYDGTTMYMYVNGNLVGSMPASGLINDPSTSLPRIGLTDNGVYGFFGTLDDVRAYDRALTQTEIQNDMNGTIVIHDVTPPVISGGQPAGTLASGTASTTLSVATDENATCKYDTVGGTAYASMANTFSTTGATSHSTSLAGLTDGSSYTYYVRCIDTVLNSNISDYAINFSVAAFVDTIYPTVSITSPSSGTTVSGVASLGAIATDNVGVVGVQFKVDGTNVNPESTASPFGVSLNSALLSNGAHMVTAVARDAAGNTTVSSGVSIFVDNAAPVVSGGQPAGVLVAGTTTANVSVVTNENATCAYSQTSGQSYAQMTSFTTTGGTSHAKSITGLSNGQSYTFYIKCKDVYNNINSSDYAINFSVANAGDTTPPTVVITAPNLDNTTASGSGLVLTATATDNVGVVGVQFKIDGVNVGAEDTVSPFSITWNSVPYANGTHTLIAVARDAAGNNAASSTVPVSVNQRIATNLNYCTSSTSDTMDIYNPLASGTGPWPVVLYFHAGGWNSGDKAEAMIQPEVAELNHRGYVVASVNYRLAPTYIFPKFVEDAKCAVRFIRANAATYNIDPNHIGAWGWSAGAYLSAMLGVTSVGTFEGTGNNLSQPSNVQAFVTYAAATDLNSPPSEWPVGGGGRVVVTNGFGVAPASGAPVLTTASPVTYATSDDAPSMVFQGTNDQIFNFHQGGYLTTALTNAGAQSTLVMVQNAMHKFVPGEGPLTFTPTRPQIVQQMADFLDSKLK